MKSLLLKPYAHYVRRRLLHRARLAVELQEEIRRELVATAADTAYGRDHDFGAITDYAGFRDRVPIGDYEAFRPYADRIKAGEADVSWPGRPRYLAKTSGTTSGVKYIPITRARLVQQCQRRTRTFIFAQIDGHVMRRLKRCNQFGVHVIAPHQSVQLLLCRRSTCRAGQNSGGKQCRSQSLHIQSSFFVWSYLACRGVLDKKVEVIHLYSQ